MRKVADIKIEKDALSFWAYLKKKGIESTCDEVDSENGSIWEIWVNDEDQISSASEYLSEFSQNPQDEKFLISPKKIKDIEKDNSCKNSSFKEIKLRNKWLVSGQQPGIVTLSMVITAVAVFLLSGMGKNTEIVGSFFISERVDGRLSEFLSGEIWRVITPIFLHFNFLHIIFNMFWLYDLGSQIESKKGSKFFVTFLIIIAIISNLTQFFVNGPAFGGMSGVVYGLFGYVWVKSRLDPADGFHIDPTVAMIMFGFFALCFTGFLGGIANWAHAGGLLTGLAWGYGSAYRWNQGKG